MDCNCKEKGRGQKRRDRSPVFDVYPNPVNEYLKGTSNNYFASKFSEFFIDNENFCSTIGIMQKN